MCGGSWGGVGSLRDVQVYVVRGKTKGRLERHEKKYCERIVKQRDWAVVA